MILITPIFGSTIFLPQLTFCFKYLKCRDYFTKFKKVCYKTQTQFFN
jgi:hypothetical protein